MNYLASPGKDEEVANRRILSLGEFPAKVLGKDFVNAPAELHRLLANELEALIKSAKNFLRHEYAGL